MTPAPLQADTIIDARWVIPVEPPGVVLEHHSLVISGTDLVALLPTANVASRYEAKRRVVLSDHVLIPGLVNLHTHAAMTLLRGLAMTKR